MYSITTSYLPLHLSINRTFELSQLPRCCSTFLHDRSDSISGPTTMSSRRQVSADTYCKDVLRIWYVNSCIAGWTNADVLEVAVDTKSVFDVGDSAEGRRQEIKLTPIRPVRNRPLRILRICKISAVNRWPGLFSSM